MHPYQNPDLSIDERLDDLMPRMTMEEKIGEMMQLSVRDMPSEQLREDHVGSYAFAMGHDANAWQERASQNRLGIPAMSALDAIHGHALFPRGAIFPSQLAMSCSWNPAVVEEAGRVTALECRATGVHWTFSPVLDVARDLRWGRINETFGEDTFLVGVLGEAMIRGYQGDTIGDPDRILATAKHFAGYPDTQGGRDASESDITRRRLMTTYLPPFERAIRAGCATVMTAYHSIDGTPCTVNQWLLTDLLRDQWGFEGIVTTDAGNIWYMHTRQMVSATEAEAAGRATEAGNDIINCSSGLQKALAQALEEGRTTEEAITRAARRVLRLKLALGLFDEHRHHDESREASVIGCADHRAATLDAARQSLVLLKNDNQTLPFGDDVNSIALIGPNADDPVAQLGDWVLGANPWESPDEKQPRDHIVTVRDALARRDGIKVQYVKGCDVMDPSDHQIDEAVAAATSADRAVLVLGDTNLLNGELKDRADLQLTGAQQELLERVHATGTPVVLVLVCGKPLTIPWAHEHVPAIAVAWNPGMEGGTAVADMLFGEYAPVGKLTISWPKHVGQLPVYYNQIPGWHADRYVDTDAEALYPFGHGLSYTSYSYADLQLSAPELRPGEQLTATVAVTNDGSRAGTEIVQLYVNDVYSSVTTPVLELKAFARVTLEPGETRTVDLTVNHDSLSLVAPDLTRTVEPGDFEILVGPSSRRDTLLAATLTVPQE